MPWVKFTRDFDWNPVKPVTVAYKAGMCKMVTTPCAKAAIAKGAAYHHKPEGARSTKAGKSYIRG